MKQRTIFLILLSSGLCGFLLSLYLHIRTPQDLPTEIREMQTFHSPVSFVKQIKNDPDAGRKIFNEFCGVCHGREPQIDIAAPRIGDKKVWKTLRSIGINTLLKITITGAGAMPARGGCFECSDQQLRETIQYILDQS